MKELSAELEKAPSLVFVNFHGLSVAESTAMRRSLRAKECSYKVAKKTLIRKALEKVHPEGALPELNGEVALSWGADPLAPAQGVFEFVKTYKDRLQILGGIFERRYITKDEVIRLASIPSREVLYAQLLRAMQGPVSGFAGVLGNTVGSFVRVLNEVAKVRS